MGNNWVSQFIGLLIRIFWLTVYSFPSQVHGQIVLHSMKLHVRVDSWLLRLFSHRFTNIYMQ